MTSSENGKRHPSIEEFADKFSVGEHLPPGLSREVSTLYRDMYLALLAAFPTDSIPLTHALNNLWDSKNHAVFNAAVRVPKIPA